MQSDDSADPHDLSRFVAAQRATYDGALDEIRAGRKQSHWMWYVFPQIEGRTQRDFATVCDQEP